MMKTYVINLKEREDRRISVEKQLSGRQLDYEFFEAVEADDNPERYFDSINTWSFCLETGDPPSAPEIACYASHLCLWQRCVDLGEPVAIFEDDFVITDDFSIAFRYAEEKMATHEFIRLEPTSTRFRRNPKLAPVIVERTSQTRLVIERAVSLRLTGYMISPSCARAFIQLSKSLKGPVDYVPRWNFRHHQAIYAVEPPAIALSDLANESSIAGRKNKTWMRHILRPATSVLRQISQARTVRESEKTLRKLLAEKLAT
jgi:glycosyl transferase family 25